MSETNAPAPPTGGAHLRVIAVAFRGGPIFPAIFLAVALASLPVVWFGVSPTLAVAVGVAAGMAAQSGLLFSPILFAALLVAAGTDAIPAAVLAAVAAWSTKAALDRRTEPPLSPRQVYRAMLVLGRGSAGTTDQQQRR